MRTKLLLIVVGLVATLTVGWLVTNHVGERQPPLIHYVVEPADLPIVLEQPGTLQAELATTIHCEVENIAVDRRTFGTQIIYIVSNGVRVEEGDLLVEFESSGWREKIDIKVLAVAKRLSFRLAATTVAENQKHKNDTALHQAILQLELAELELQMYIDEANGTLQLALEDVDRKIDDVKNQIHEAQAAMRYQQAEMSSMQELESLGFREKRHVKQSHLSLLQANNRLVAHANKLRTHQAERRKLETHQRELQILQLRGAVTAARRNIEEVRQSNRSTLKELEAIRDQAIQAEEEQREKLENFRAQMDLCKIYAPHDGIVVYADQEGGEPIAEGVMVRYRQPLITIPDLSRMQVETELEEDVIDLVRPGLPIVVRLDSRHDERYQGAVRYVASVPDAGELTGAKTYQAIGRIDGEVDGLRPGMAAVVEIHVQRLRDVLSVPVQAVERRGRDTWCFVDTDRGVVRRTVKLGPSNGKFVHIRKGLTRGDRVVLNPMAILDG